MNIELEEGEVIETKEGNEKFQKTKKNKVNTNSN